MLFLHYFFPLPLFTQMRVFRQLPIYKWGGLAQGNHACFSGTHSSKPLSYLTGLLSLRAAKGGCSGVTSQPSHFCNLAHCWQLLQSGMCMRMGSNFLVGVGAEQGVWLSVPQ